MFNLQKEINMYWIIWNNYKLHQKQYCRLCIQYVVGFFWMKYQRFKVDIIKNYI